MQSFANFWYWNSFICKQEGDIQLSSELNFLLLILGTGKERDEAGMWTNGLIQGKKAEMYSKF